MTQATIIAAIEQSPLNRGLNGADWLANPRNIPFVEGKDVILFDDEGFGVYHIHLLLQSRGKAALAAIRRAITQLFCDHGASLIFGLIPVERRHVKLVGRWLNFECVGTVQRAFGLCDLFILTRDMWKAKVQ